MNTLENKVALVTGASGGIGRSVAVELVKHGARVIVNYSGNKIKGEETVAAITSIGGDAIIVKADVGNAADVVRLFDKSIEAFGKIDILVNNAGILIIKPLRDCTDEEFDRLFNINVKGTFHCLREAATRLADNGSIINISSAVTRTNFANYGIYAGTKAAIDQFTRIFSKEVANRGINVNSVQPGPIATEPLLNGKTEEQIAKIAAASPFNRLGDPIDVARVVVFLASDDAKWISGQNIAVDGAR